MNFKQIEAFYWLTQLHNHQRVADHLGLTQPAVSARIAGLEDFLKTQLIDRASPGFQLTEQGHQVADFAEMFVNLREAMNNRLQEGRKHRYAVGMVGMVTVTWGMSFRRKVSDWDPNLILDVNSAGNVDLQRQLSSGLLDMAFGTDDMHLPHVPNSFTVKYKIGWIARPDVAGDISRPRTPEELREMPLILFPRTSPLSRPVLNLLEESLSRPNARHSGNSRAAICEMIRLGFGVAPVALAGLEAELEAGTLVEIPTTQPLAPLDIRCVHLNRARKVQTEQVYELAREAARDWCEAHPEYLSYDPG